MLLQVANAHVDGGWQVYVDERNAAADPGAGRDEILPPTDLHSENEELRDGQRQQAAEGQLTWGAGAEAAARLVVKFCQTLFRWNSKFLDAWFFHKYDLFGTLFSSTIVK